jgi:capsular polysaccharide biosynthesis protein
VHQEQDPAEQQRARRTSGGKRVNSDLPRHIKNRLIRIASRMLSSDGKRIARSGLFDLNWYRGQLGADAGSELSLKRAILHYLSTGAQRGLDPNPFFDTDWYLRTNPDVARAGFNPLAHFLEWGAREKRNPSKQFDVVRYEKSYPELAPAGINPLAHFLQYGKANGRISSREAVYSGLARRLMGIKNRILPSDGERSQKWPFVLRSVRDVAADWGWKISSSNAPAASSFHEELHATVARDTPDRLAFPPAPFLVSALNVVVIGKTRHLIGENQTIVNDEIEHFFDEPDVAVKGNDAARTGDRELTITLIRAPGNVMESGIHLMHEYAHNYFHVLTEILPRVVLANSMSCAADLPMLLDKEMEKNFRDLIETLAPDRRAVYLDKNKTYTVGRLEFLSDISSIQDIYTRPRRPHETVLHIGLIRQAVEQILSRSGFIAPPPPRRRLYVRRGSRYRALLNEVEIEEKLAGLGFELLSVDGLSMKTQIGLFREAEVVIAPTGAALSNMVWCQRGTPVIILAPNHPAMPVEIWTQLAKVSGCQVEVLQGPRAFNYTGPFDLHDDYTVALEDVAGRVAALGYR